MGSEGVRLVFLVSMVLSCFGLLAQGMMLWLQVSALRRHRHSFFWMLVAATLLDILSCVMAIVLYAMPLPIPVHWVLFGLASMLTLVAMVLGVAGSWLLFRSYTRYVAQSEALAESH